MANSPNDETSLAETGAERKPASSSSRSGWLSSSSGHADERDSPRHHPRGPLPHRRPARARRHGRGVPRRRPAARPARRAEVPARGGRRRSAAPGAVPQRGAHRAPGVAPQRLPRLRHRRGRRAHLPDDGVRGRRGPGVAAQADRAVAAGEGHRDRAADLRRAGRRARPAACCTATSSRPTSCSTARAGSASPTSAWPAWPRRSRTCDRARRPTWRRSSSPGARCRCRATSSRWGWCSTRSSPGAGPSTPRPSPSCCGCTTRGCASRATSTVRDLDPAIERVIVRCLEPEPARRPPSAMAVSAALPGGDPLAAALAAGETPSPEMVAAAGRTDAVPLAQAAAWPSSSSWPASSRSSPGRAATASSGDPVGHAARRARRSRAQHHRPLRLSATRRPTRPARFTSVGDYLQWVRANRTGADRWQVLGDRPHAGGRATGIAPARGRWCRSRRGPGRPGTIRRSS